MLTKKNIKVHLDVPKTFEKIFNEPSRKKFNFFVTNCDIGVKLQNNFRKKPYQILWQWYDNMCPFF